MKKTSLYEEHLSLNAKIVNFAQFLMPLHYGSPIEEHLAVRQGVGIFDVSHMGEIIIEGDEASNFIQYLTCNDLSKISNSQAQYNAFLTEKGTFVDDLLVYKKNEKSYFLVVNAANTEKDFEWVKSKNKFKAEVKNISSEISQIALQGPLAEELLQNLVNIPLSNIKYYRFIETEVASFYSLLSRTGYTGEDGFEIYLSNEEAPKLWKILLKEGEKFGIRPCGLVARDTLRLEAKMALYGNDIDDEHTPLEAGLEWIVKLEKGDFLGRSSLLEQKEKGVKKILCGFEMVDRGVPRHNYEVFVKGEKVSKVTSGSYAPYLKKNIGLCYLPIEFSKIGTEIEILIRDKKLKAQVVPTPFYKRKKS